MQDLQPYSCVLEDCPIPDDLYGSRKDWETHMQKIHSADKWICYICPQSPQIFKSAAEYESHLLQSPIHVGTFTEAQLPLLVEDGRTPTIPDFLTCPLCNWSERHAEFDELPSQQSQIHNVKTTNIQDHIAEHLHSFALQALPDLKEGDVDSMHTSVGSVENNLKNLLASDHMTTLSYDDAENHRMYSLWERLFNTFAALTRTYLDDSQHNTPADFSPPSVRDWLEYWGKIRKVPPPFWTSVRASDIDDSIWALDECRRALDAHEAQRSLLEHTVPRTILLNVFVILRELMSGYQSTKSAAARRRFRVLVTVVQTCIFFEHTSTFDTANKSYNLYQNQGELTEVEQTYSDALAFEGHSDSVTSAAFSSNGKQVISGSKDRTIRPWDAATGAPLQTLEGHSRPPPPWPLIRRQAFISGSYDNMIADLHDSGSDNEDLAVDNDHAPKKRTSLSTPPSLEKNFIGSAIFETVTSKPSAVISKRAGPYKYRSLEGPSENFRLLSIMPAQHITGRVHVSISHCLIDDAPEYRALCYCWDYSNFDFHDILVDGLALSVRKNLFEALLAIRDQDSEIRLWVDALCINMGNMEERSHQIVNMRRIFSNASSVWVWLGTEEGVSAALGQLGMSFELRLSKSPLEGDLSAGGSVVAGSSSPFGRVMRPSATSKPPTLTGEREELFEQGVLQPSQNTDFSPVLYNKVFSRR
jgi:hypothetical protein